MKKIINGLRYDTETATEVTVLRSGEDDKDDEYFTEALYKTQKGAWFIVGNGGIDSKYGLLEEMTGLVMDMDLILPLTEDEVMARLEEHNEVELLEEHFGDRIDDA